MIEAVQLGIRINDRGVNYSVILKSCVSQNKVFVYRGLEYERIETFTHRLQTEFPSAQILTKNNPPSHAILQSDSQCKNLTRLYALCRL